MKTSLRLPAGRGFSLVELLIAMGISTILMAALASIFATSVNTREKIDREGQKIETARYSLDTLAEDIRLAGYYGNYSPPFTGATPADWKYADPCATTGGSPLPGWDATTAPVQVPFPIFGYEAHGTASLPTGLTGCLDNYKTDTDVFVIRRAATTSICVPSAVLPCVTTDTRGYLPGETYLQVSSCPDGTVDTRPFNAKTTAAITEFSALTSNGLHVLGCTSSVPGANASVRKLITRIYYISQCDDCVNNLDNDAATTGDGIPTLKMVELRIPDSGGTTLRVIQNLRTIAPGVEDMHLEYGIDTTDDGAIDSYTVSAPVPCTSSCAGKTAVGNPTEFINMRVDAAGEYRWEDVMAVKLFLVTRDLKATAGYTDTKSFILGSTTVAAANDAYRRRMTNSTIKLVNMSGRREVP